MTADPAARLAAFKRIKEHYDALDRDGLRRGELPMHTTDWGFWGTTNMNDAYTFFSRIRLERFRRFADFGCGDGRIVLIASLFTDAVGVEGDEELVAVGNEAIGSLGLEASGGHSAALKAKNYYEEDLSEYDILFMFPDKRFDDEMLEKLRREFKGHLFVYNRIHSPEGFPAGKTYWVDQLPIASFPLGVEDRNLELQ